MSVNSAISIEVSQHTNDVVTNVIHEKNAIKKAEPYPRDYPPEKYLQKAKQKFDRQEDGILRYETDSKYQNGLNLKYEQDTKQIQTPSGHKLGVCGWSPDILLFNSPFLWQFIPDLASSGGLSYTRKLQALFGAISVLFILTSASFHDSPVLVPAIIVSILNVLIQVSLAYFTIWINRLLVERVKCVLSFRLCLNIGPPDNIEYSTASDEHKWLEYLSSVFLDVEDCSKTLDSFAIDPPVTIQPVMWFDFPFALVFRCVPDSKSKWFSVIRWWSYLVHFVLYFSPLLWIFSSDRSYQIKWGSIHAAITFILLLFVLYRDCKRTSIHLDHAVKEYFLQLIHYRFRLRHVKANYRESIKNYYEDQGKFHAINFQRFLYAILVNEFSQGLECVDLSCCFNNAHDNQYQEM